MVAKKINRKNKKPGVKQNRIKSIFSYGCSRYFTAQAKKKQLMLYQKNINEILSP